MTKSIQQYCAKEDRCRANYENSLCKPRIIDNEQLFECLCDRTIFTLQSSTPTKLPNGKGSLRMESCKLRDLCNEQPKAYGCKDPVAHCNLMVNYQAGEYTPESFCTCPKSNIVLTNKDRFCKSSCDGYCKNGECANDVFNASKIVCKCPDGFTGERCEKKLDIKTKVEGGGNEEGTNAFKIATIVLSIVLGIAIVGLVVLFLKR